MELSLHVLQYFILNCQSSCFTCNSMLIRHPPSHYGLKGPHWLLTNFRSVHSLLLILDYHGFSITITRRGLDDQGMLYKIWEEQLASGMPLQGASWVLFVSGWELLCNIVCTGSKVWLLQQRYSIYYSLFSHALMTRDAIMHYSVDHIFQVFEC